MNRDDYLRPLRALLRELVRQLRQDLPLASVCRNLLKERRDQTFRDFTPKERMMAALADLVSLCILLAVSPAVREAAGLAARSVTNCMLFQVSMASYV
jgi:integrator complex subunit 1